MINLQEISKSDQLFDGRYTLEKCIGTGGFSEVWLAFDVRSQVKVVLKVYTSAQGLDKEGIEMFRREFSLVCNLNQTNILKPFTFDIHDGVPYIVMPYCERGSASKYIGKMSEDELWTFCEQVAEGLDYLHAHSIIHQDIKPANVLINADGQYLITDFGISTGLRRTMRRTTDSYKAGSGTTAYMSYECLASHPKNVMARDIWALGASMFELIEEEVPYGEYGGITQKSMLEEPLRFTRKVSDDMRALIVRCLAFNTWERPSAGEILQLVANHKAGKPIAFPDTTDQVNESKIMQSTSNNALHSNRKRLLVGALTVVLLIAGGGVAWHYLPAHFSSENKVKQIAQDTVIQPSRDVRNDSLMLLKVNQAKKLVSSEKAKHAKLDQINERTLVQAASLYKEAMQMEATPATVEQVKKEWAASQTIIDKTYQYLSGREAYYQDMGASGAAKEFGVRAERLKAYVTKESDKTTQTKSKAHSVRGIRQKSKESLKESEKEKEPQASMALRIPLQDTPTRIIHQDSPTRTR